MKRNDHHKHIPPISVHHEQPTPTTEAVKQLFKQDPDYARWVLFRSEELVTRLETWVANGIDLRKANLKERLAALLLEAREIELAIQHNRELLKLFEAPARRS